MSLTSQSPNRRLNVFTTIKVLFGGAHVQIASILFWGLLSLTIWLVSMYGTGITIGGEWVPAKGLYLGMGDSSMEINDEPVYPYYFAYSVNGQPYEGYSYDYYKEYTKEEEIEIEYQSNDPKRSRIIGMTETPTNFIITYILAFVTLISLLMLFFGLRANQKYFYLLRHGRIAQGRYLRSRATSTKINDETVYEYEFEFEVDERSYIAKCKTHLHNRVEDEETETILYDPRDPNYNVVSDAVSDIKPTQRRGGGRSLGAEMPQAGIGALSYLMLPLGGALVAFLVYVSSI